ncbi:hypothetical protein VDG1235_302 [Verrucomicrobiia bacterium DG1235]|nr:hypothetical protein VDG1235_302 [Verrucomicrobiae bacterium DG1235]
MDSMDTHLKNESGRIMRIDGYVVAWSRSLGLVDCLVGLGLVLFPSSILSLMGLNPVHPRFC